MGTAGIWQFEVEQNDLPDSSAAHEIECALSSLSHCLTPTLNSTITSSSFSSVLFAQLLLRMEYKKGMN